MAPPKSKLKTLISLSKLFFTFSLLLHTAIADDGAFMSKLAKSLTPPPSGWSGNSFCSWNGVKCDGSDRVTSLNLASKSLTGTLPSDLNSLSQLATLSLQSNSLTGALPSLANLTMLQTVFLGSNNFSSIPDGCFVGLTSLQKLSLTENTNLKPWKLPTDLTQSSNLVELDLGSGIVNLWLNNQNDGSGFTGSIDLLASMSHLAQVWFQKNKFTGSIPDLSNCTNLFDLQLRDNQLTGVVPSSLMSLSSLANVSLDNNKLQGPLPSFGKGVKATLDEGINSFCKSTPGPCDPRVSTLLDIAAGFGYPLSLANSWKGNDPCDDWAFVVCSGGKIVTVNLPKQNLNGTISPAFGNLTDLRNLYLNGNNLTGSIPGSLTGLTQLEVLDVSDNNLSGEIPKFSGKVRFKSAGNVLLGKSGADGGSGTAPPTDSSGGPIGSPSGKRVAIALDVARGVEYLHSLAQQSFIHRDLKPSNILLGDDMRAKVADFGLVKNAPDGKYSVETRLAGTFGYLAPEYAATGRVTTKVDVYAFGVVLMELITGRRALDDTMPDERSHLVSWFRRVLVNKENIPKAIDQTLNPDEETMESIYKIAELAGHCTAREPYQRPDMGHAVNVLVPLVEQWKPSNHEEEDGYGIDLHMSLPQALQRWQANEGTSTMFNDMSFSQTQSSIPSKPSGFADSFDSMDCR